MSVWLLVASSLMVCSDTEAEQGCDLLSPVQINSPITPVPAQEIEDFWVVGDAPDDLDCLLCPWTPPWICVSGEEEDDS